MLQTYTVTPIDIFRTNLDNPTKHHYPTETFVLLKDGVVPSVKRPKTNGSVLFNAKPQSRRDMDAQGKDSDNGISFTWEPGRIRINDDHSMRPSVFPGTHTPLNIQHELSLRVFFSVKGETMDGTPIQERDGKDGEPEGEMRMLVINVAERVSSVGLLLVALFHARMSRAKGLILRGLLLC